MTNQKHTSSPRRCFSGRIPAFCPVPVRRHHNGWTPDRQGHFIGFLAQTGSIAQAARMVGMSRQSAYALRKHPDAGGFAAAWDAALGLPVPKVTVSDFRLLTLEAMIRPIMRGGLYCGLERKVSTSAILPLLDRLMRPSPLGRAKDALLR